MQSSDLLFFQYGKEGEEIHSQNYSSAETYTIANFMENLTYATADCTAATCLF